jgi:hypothetical protein
MNEQTCDISEITRRDILDDLYINKYRWWGSLDSCAFLSRLGFDLEQMPSTDHRYSNAYGDIWQHQENNNDWNWN